VEANLVRRGIALVGAGRTGGLVAKALPEGLLVGTFNRSNPISAEVLRKCEAVIVFTPAEALSSLIPLLIEGGAPVVCGTTGFQWSEDFKRNLKNRGLPWIVASNFSIGMNYMFTVGRLLGHRFRELNLHPGYRLREVHHIHKLDSPSGTALSWQSQVGEDFPIEAFREGDEKGLHELHVTLDGEELMFRHRALDRMCFAKGAVLAAQEFLPGLDPGLHRFEDLYFKKFTEAL
jgi:4-hydroxy-tetrahydrodipicolinate reductase